MKPLARHILQLLVCAAIVAAGAALAVTLTSLRGGDAGADAAAPHPEPEAVNVRVEVLRGGTVEDAVTLTGRVTPWESVVLSAEIAGRIESQEVDAGDTVKAGQELIRIDTSSLTAERAQASARHTLAEQEMKRIQGLRNQGIASPQDWDRAQSEFRVAAAELENAGIRLSRSVLKAPFDGVVDEHYLETGEFVDVGKPLIRIIQVDRVKAVFGLPERDAPALSVGDKVRLAADAHAGEQFEGVIRYIAASADVSTRTFGVELGLANDDGKLRPGMTVRGRFVRKAFENAVTVPIFSIISLENQRFVVVEEDGIARIRPVEIGVFSDNRVHITGGVQPGERLIVAGHRDLRDGARVRVTAEQTE